MICRISFSKFSRCITYFYLCLGVNIFRPAPSIGSNGNILLLKSSEIISLPSQIAFKL